MYEVKKTIAPKTEKMFDNFLFNFVSVVGNSVSEWDGEVRMSPPGYCKEP